jgi:predicted glycoside hydrolase/deacetylase ChbG (UPF0249 family)
MVAQVACTTIQDNLDRTPGRRVLIVNADDFGISDGVNHGVMQAHVLGIVTSASLMVRRPAARQAVAMWRGCPRLSLGLHVDLGEWTLRNGEWITVYEIVDLLDEAAAAREIDRQVQAFTELTGRNPTHLDSHQHVHCDEAIRSITVELAERLSIPLRHFCRNVKYRGDFYGQARDGSPIPGALTANALISILNNLEGGATELACHPALFADVDTMYRQERTAELRALCDQTVHSAIERLGIELRSFENVFMPATTRSKPAARTRLPLQVRPTIVKALGRSIASRKKIVLFGMMSRIPVAGNVWLVLHYMLGFRRLGYDVYYVEAHGRTPCMLMQSKDDDGPARAASFIEGVMRRFDFDGSWAFHALHGDRSCRGLTEGQLTQLYRSADLIINLHGGTIPQPEHKFSDRLVLLETDPVELEIKIHQRDELSTRFLKAHNAFFTWGENYGAPDCGVPIPDQLPFHPTRAPVICDLWEDGRFPEAAAFTTIGNWHQPGYDLEFQGEVYCWSKHHEFLKFVDLPQRVNQPFELALGSLAPDDESLLREHGWSVRPAMSFSTDLDAYRDYIRSSRGEFTVAKDQNVRLRSGWFSERSAQYLAAGRPVITQETGFSNVLPTGRGLFSFSTMDEVLAAVDAIKSDYRGHCRAASELAHEYFNFDVVLPRLLKEVGL